MIDFDSAGSSNEILVLTLVGIVVFSFLFLALWLWQNRATPRVKAPRAAHASSVGHVVPGPTLPEQHQPLAPLHTQPSEPSLSIAPLPPVAKRKQTLLVAKSGQGKTQALISIALADLRAGGAVWWLSPDATAYNEEDQPTDLNGLAISIVDDYKDIAAHIRAASALIEQRKPAYKTNQPKGQPVTLLIDEWPAIAAFEPELAKDLKTILFLGRKVGVWLVLASQSPYVDDLKLGAGLRAAFHTALGRGRDRAGQRALGIDQALDCKALDMGFWGCVVDGSTSIAAIPMASIRPTDYNLPAPTVQLVANANAADHANHAMLVSLLQTDDLDDSNHVGSDNHAVAASATDSVPVPDKRAISKLSPEQQLDYIIATLDRAGVSANCMKNHLQLTGNNNDRMARIRAAINSPKQPN